jgi:hypothetical protein
MGHAVSRRAPLRLSAKVGPSECLISASRHFGVGKVPLKKLTISNFGSVWAELGRFCHISRQQGE